MIDISSGDSVGERVVLADSVEQHTAGIDERQRQ
jgi:hypothetical protein